MLSDVMMKYLDDLSASHLALEKKLDRERRRTQRCFMEANPSAVTYHHQLSILSQVSICVRLQVFLTNKVQQSSKYIKIKRSILLDRFLMKAF